MYYGQETCDENEGVRCVAAILVDYENVSATDGLKGVEYLNGNDTLIIFYSQCCEKIRAEYIDMIERSHCEFRTYKLARTGKNALDFYIAVECGFLSVKGEKHIVIISKDKGFRAISDYFNIKTELEEITVRTAPNIENALVAINTLENNERKKSINEKSKMLNIATEQVRIEERRTFVHAIEKIFEGTKYEDKTDKILRFVEGHESESLKFLYTGSLQEFGREDGRAIYRILKKDYIEGSCSSIS